MSKEQKRLMEDPDKLLREARSPLTILFRKILAAERVDATTWNKRLTTYLKSDFSACPKNAKDIGQERNNFNRAIAKPEITFRTFHRAIEILGYPKYSMTMTLIDKDGVRRDVSTPDLLNRLADLYSLKGTLTGDVGPITSVDGLVDDDDDLDMQYELLEDTWQQLPDPEPTTPSSYQIPKRRYNTRK